MRMLLVLVFLCTLSTPVQADYRISLDRNRPEIAHVVMEVPALENISGPLFVQGNPASVSDIICDGHSLPLSESYMVPSDCRLLEWTMQLRPIDVGGMDATQPFSGWSEKSGYWILSNGSGWLSPAHYGEATVRIDIFEDGKPVEQREMHYPGKDQPPFYAIVGRKAGQLVANAGKQLNIYGEVVEGDWRLQADLAITEAWAGWDREIGFAPETAFDELDIAWLPRPENFEPGFLASAGDRTIFMAGLVDENDPSALQQMRTVYRWVTAHEIFHSFIGATGQGWPEWVNESLANYFAWQMARNSMEKEDLQYIETLLFSHIPALSILDAQRQKNNGDGSASWTFYVKGPLFWDAVSQSLDLPEPAGTNGKLAMLMQRSRNFSGVDWSDPDAIKKWFNGHSSGRAGNAIDKYLTGSASGNVD